MTDLEVYKKNTADFVFTIKEDDAIIDITGYTFYMTCKEDITDTDADAKFKKVVTTHTDPENGVTTISLSSDELDLTLSGPSQTYVYDILMKDTSSKITTIMTGIFKVLPRVTTDTS